MPNTSHEETILLSIVVKFSQSHAYNIHKSTSQSYHLAMVINENYITVICLCIVEWIIYNCTPLTYSYGANMI